MVQAWSLTIIMHQKNPAFVLGPIKPATNISFIRNHFHYKNAIHHLVLIDFTQASTLRYIGCRYFLSRRQIFFLKTGISSHVFGMSVCFWVRLQ